MSVLTDPISDFLTRFKNAGMAGREDFMAPYSEIKAEIARILKEEGYLWSYEVDTSGPRPVLKCKSRFVNGKPVLTNLQRVSRPGLRQYVSAGEIPRVLGGMGITILSTSKGLMTGHKAKAENVGGELLAKVW
jgi:small subunit ribosomal protein S8